MTKKYLLLCFFFLGLSITGSADPRLHTESVYNWQEGLITSKVTLDMRRAGLSLPSDRNAAFAIIVHELPSELKNAYFAVPVDSSTRVGDYLARRMITLSDILMLINEDGRTDTALSHSLQTALFYHSLPMKNMAALFVHHTTPYKPQAVPAHTASKAYTGILIDARGMLPVHGEYMQSELEPALFPKIWNTEMELIFEKNMVDPDTAKKNGIVHYHSTLDESRYREYIGTNPLRIIARGVFGQNRTDPIIALDDSAKILSRPENLELLKEGRVVILCNNASLRYPMLPLPDEQFYFVYHDVEKKLAEKQPDSITISRPGKDIKLTMYDIRFVADQADILPGELWKLDVIAEALLKIAPNADFLIEGHTANLNRPKNELKLSIERAQRIADELSERGIPADRIETAGYGSTRPAAPSDTAENRAKNRRVEITILRN